MSERTADPAPKEEALLKVLRALDANPHTSQREVAESIRVSLGKANYCLEALIDKGLVKVRHFRSSQDKLGYTYLLTTKGAAAKARLTRRFLKRRLAEYEALRKEIEALKMEVGGCSV